MDETVFINKCVRHIVPVCNTITLSMKVLTFMTPACKHFLKTI